MTVISQPRYLPALNYLQRMHGGETFIFLDTVQRQARGFENRNKLLLGAQTEWLTVPITSSSRALIVDTKISGLDWIDEHQSKITTFYQDCPFFDEGFLASYYQAMKDTLASSEGSFTQAMLTSYQVIFSFLNLAHAKFLLASDLEKGETLPAKGPEKLLWLCEKSKASKYLSGPNGAEYGIGDSFSPKTIPCVFHQFNHPEHPQLNLNPTAEFIPYLGFLDAFFNAGPNWLAEFITTKLAFTSP